MIYVNGDSWTAGWPDEETYGHRLFAWPHLLSVKMNDTVINDARAGSSNHRIYRRTFDYLLTHKPEIAIVALTGWVRFEQGRRGTGKIWQHVPNGQGADYKDWNPYLAYTNFLRQIISLQCVAKQTNTKLYLLDTFDENLLRNPTYEWFVEALKLSDAFDSMNDDMIADKFKKVLALNALIDYTGFISEHSYRKLILGAKLIKDHPTIDGHEKIADIIYNKLKE